MNRVRNSIRRIVGAVAAAAALVACQVGTPTASIVAHQTARQALPGQAARIVPGRTLVRFQHGRLGAGLSSLGPAVRGQVESLGIAIVDTTDARAVRTLADLRGSGAIVYAEPETVVSCKLALSHPMASRQGGLRSVGAPRAWDLTRGRPEVVVAVLDTGIDLEHPDLRARLVPGISFVPGTFSPQDDHGHGTHVAGIVGAEPLTPDGAMGVAPGCRLMPVKVLDAQGSGTTSRICQGIVWAVDHGARVLNLSLGGAGGGKSLEAAVAYAISRGVVVVAAMGNEGANIQEYPAGYPGVIAVGATDDGGRVASFSNIGRWISLSAPGSDIYSTMPMRSFTLLSEDPGAAPGHGVLSGTSMATPFVTGVAALMISLQPMLTPDALRARLERTAQDLATPGFDTATGFGLVQADLALGLSRGLP
jgi:thermitase